MTATFSSSPSVSTTLTGLSDVRISSATLFERSQYRLLAQLGLDENFALLRRRKMLMMGMVPRCFDARWNLPEAYRPPLYGFLPTGLLDDARPNVTPFSAYDTLHYFISC